MIFGIVMKEAGFRDSNEKEAGMWDQNPPFPDSLLSQWPSLIKTHKSLDRCYATILISLILPEFY